MEGGEADCLTSGLCRPCFLSESDSAQTQSVVLTIAAVASGSDLQQAVGLSRSHCRFFVFRFASTLLLCYTSGRLAPIAQWIEQWFPKP